jgi:hypothetical protein
MHKLAHPNHLRLDPSWLCVSFLYLAWEVCFAFEYRLMDTYQVCLAALAAKRFFMDCAFFVVYRRILVIK